MNVETLLSGVVIPVDKPRQWTSFQTVNRIKSVIRSHFGIKKFKIGHAGTLDPLATGLLLVCVGKATKDIEMLQSGEKEYTGTMVLGATTPCYDLEQPIDHFYDYQHITEALLNDAATTLTGAIMQVPPMFSAVKIDGERAYQYARRDQADREPQARQVIIQQFNIEHFIPGKPTPSNIPLQQQETVSSHAPHRYNNPIEEIPEWLPRADFHVCCSKGTYIRSLVRDLGAEMQSGAFLASLRRTRIGDYTVDNAITLNQIDALLKGDETFTIAHA